MDRIQFIQHLINKRDYKTYLEIGVYGGACFFNIKIAKKIGVDPNFIYSKLLLLKHKLIILPNRMKFYHLTSDEFFSSRSKKLSSSSLDIVFIDGLHTYKQSLRDTMNSLSLLNDNGIIILHDCNPNNEIAAQSSTSYACIKESNPKGWNGEWNGDVWKTIVYLRSYRDDLDVSVIDTDFGLGVIRKGRANKMLQFSDKDILSLSYQDLENDRINLLNLTSPDNFLNDI